MKKLIVFFIAIGFMIPVMAQKVVKDDYNSLKVQFTTGDVHIEQTVLDGETFSTVTIDGYSLSLDNYGSPALPVFSRIIEVPLCEGFKVEVTNAIYDTIGPLKHLVVPTQPSRSKSDTSAFKLFMLHEVYSWNAFVGERQAFVEPVGIARDRNLARLQFSPVSYNPVSGQLIVCRKATVTVIYTNPDVEATQKLFNRYYSPAFHSGANALNSLYPKTVSNAAPVRYIIVANSMFRGHMDTFVQWKMRKGFLADIVYTDEAAVGTTTTSIKAYLQSQYTNATAANPAPTYVLLVGDVAQIPAFNGTERNSHVTDLYYCTWTSGDIIPDCHYGRFSAQNVEQLIPQIQKTLMYEQYTFADPSFLDRAVMVAGIDGGSSGDHGYTHGDPAMDYGITNYFNGAHGFSNVYYFKNNTSIVPQGVTNVTVSSNASSNAATIRNYYSQGAGFINYTAHGSSSGWYNPGFETSHVPSMTNTQKFGIMIGNCCQTNMFGESECFGEALLRRNNYCGAVGYIGGSEVTYWDEDFYWAVGVRSTINANISMAYNASNLGVYDRSFHTHNEAFSEWATNQSSLIYFGNMAVQSSGSSLANYYWEIYHLMGDPSVMNYLTQASLMTVNAPSAITYGATTLNVTAAPYAYVALTDTATHTVKAAAWANASGLATLQLPSNLAIGGYEITASASQYRTAFHTISIINPQNAFVTVNSVTPAAALVAGDTVMLNFVVENAGNTDAQNVTMRLTSSNNMLTLITDSLNLGSVNSGAQLDVNNQILAVINPAAADLTNITLTATVQWTGCTTPAVSFLPLTIVAPSPVLSVSSSDFVMLPGTSTSLTATVRNAGHAPLNAAQLTLYSPAALLTVSPTSTPAVNIAAGDSVTSLFTINADASLPQNVELPIDMQLSFASTNSPVSNPLSVYLGAQSCETFENNFNFSGWTQGSKPWIVVTDISHNGTHSIRSAQNLSNYNGKSETTLSCTYTRPDSIAFYYKVSSERNYDKFHFYIDGTDMITSNNSGEIDWTRATFPVTAGTHTFKFSYEKDISQASGSDCVWIDDVTLPRIMHNVIFADIDTCYTGTEPLPAYTVAANETVTIYNYTIRTAYSLRDTVVGCDSCIWNGTVYNTSISFLDTLPSSVPGQCDSIIGVDVVVHPSVADTVEYLCLDSIYSWNGTVYTTDGEYTQTLATVFGCDSVVTLILTFDTTPGVGIVTVDGGQINVYPNPTVNTVHFSRSVDEATLFDLNGRMLVRRNDVHSLDMATLPAGTYVLRLRNGDASATCRVIKK